MPESIRTWGLPAEPGPEVTAVRDKDRLLWRRVERGWKFDARDGVTNSWRFLIDHCGPLTDATAEVTP